MWEDHKIETPRKHKYREPGKERVRTVAALIFHELYPRRNFFDVDTEWQLKFENLVRKLYAIGNSRNLPKG
jgi:hypothetical protein